MRSEFESDVFDKEKDGSFKRAISQIGKGFGQEDFYPTLEKKAATHLPLLKTMISLMTMQKPCLVAHQKQNY